MPVVGGPDIITSGLDFLVDPKNSESSYFAASDATDLITLTSGILGTDVSCNGDYFIHGISSIGTTFGDLFDVTTENYTLGVWVNLSNPPGPGTYCGFLGRAYLAGSIGYGIYSINSSRKFSMQSRNGGVVRSVDTISTWEYDTWYYVVSTRTYGDYPRIYVDGELDATGIVLDEISCGPSADLNFRMGSNSENSLPLKNSKLGLAHKYNRALSALEILQNYNSLKSRYI